MSLEAFNDLCGRVIPTYRVYLLSNNGIKFSSARDHIEGALHDIMPISS